MNADRRKTIAKVQERILAALEILNSCQQDVEDVQNEEQEAFDNMPENLQGSEKGQAMEEAISLMEDLASTLNDACDTINDSLDQVVEL